MAGEEKALPQFTDGKSANLALGNGTYHDCDTAKARKQTRWKPIMIVFLAVCVLLKYTTLPVHHNQPHRQSLRHRHIPPAEAEEAFLKVPNNESAIRTSRIFGRHPHLAGSEADFVDAKTTLSLFQRELQIPTPPQEPVFPAGSKESRDATLKLSSKEAPTGPTAWIDVYYPVLDTPLDLSLSIVNDEGLIEWEADLEEDGDPRDPDAHRYRTAVLTWHGFSKAGDVTGELIYANYGSQTDYAELVAAGANFTGKIVLTRYGGIFRGLKIKGAEELGAAGVLIYSDPRDDGYVTEENGYVPYPAGPARNPTAVERGSVEYASIYPGDPSTPGYPSYKNAHREEPWNVPSIPSLPISWKNAQRLLEEIDDIYIQDEHGHKSLSGKASRNRVRLVNNAHAKVTPIWNAIAAIPGYIKDEVIIVGGHRDAWVIGTTDPISGQVSLHEIVRGLGSLLKSGWKPLRTIIIASWDGEEHGLIGSTEWAEDFAEWIGANVVAYLNVDVSVAGSRWSADASPSLAHLIRDIALSLPHPTSPDKTLWDARDDEGPYKNFNSTIDEETLEMHHRIEVKRSSHETGIGPLGSGSDFTTFLQHIGVASADQAFMPTASDAVYHYHSVYDTERWLELYGDPGFHRHVAVAKHLGLVVLRLSDSFLIPLNTTQYALELDDYLDGVEALIDVDPRPNFSALRKAISNLQVASAKLDKEKQDALDALKKLLKQPLSYTFGLLLGHYGQHHDSIDASDSIPKFLARRIKERVGSIAEFPSAVITAISRNMVKLLGDDTWDGVLSYVYANLDGAPTEDEFLPLQLSVPIDEIVEAARRVDRSNKKLMAFDRGFISEGGIKDREWYKHLVVAPGKWLGYGATTLPALTEAITLDRNVTLAEHEAGRLTDLINKLAETITPT